VSRLVDLLKRGQAKSDSSGHIQGAENVMTPAEPDSSALKSSVAFTGRLACMTRAEAFEVVRQCGGMPSQAVTKRTKLLIVGELGWPLLDDGRPSNKLSRAAAYGVPVVSERRFLEWIGKVSPDSAHKTYSAEQLASLSKLSGDRIQELAQLGLLDERAGRFGFRDLASARQIAKLLADGVRLREIISSVTEIRKWLPDSGLANVRFHPGPFNSLVVEQPGGRTDKHGQFVLVVDDCRHNPDDLFAGAQAAEEAGDIVEAERFYRLLMKGDPTDPSAAFNLGNMLRAHGRTVEAEAAFRAATRIEPTFAEAWYNLGDLLDEQGRSEVAIECLRKSLQVAPDYVDAMFNLALLLQRKNRYAEATDYWRRYLAIDGQSEWAARARRSLKFCEMQQHLIA
jgi:tetratricopeptide (TPR) repeat protein